MARAKQQTQPMPLTVVPDERGPEVIAKEIEAVADAAKSMLSSRLTRRALVILIQDAIPQHLRPGRPQIEAVLEAAAELRKYVVK